MGERSTRRRRANHPLKLEGHALLRSDDGADLRDLVNRLSVAVDAAVSRCEVTGIGTSLREVIESSSPHVRRFLRDLDAAARKTSAQRRIGQPYSKQQQVGRTSLKGRPHPDDAVPCPACEGGRWPDCPLCGGGGTVSRRQARGYRGESC